MNEAPIVAVVNPGSSDPVGASTSPEIQHQYPAQRPNIFPVAGLENVPTSDVTVEEVEITALRKPYLGAPTPVSQNVLVCQGFNLGQDGQSRIPQFFTMGTSASLGLSPPEVTIKEKQKNAPNTKPEREGPPGWYYSEFSERWCKTEELLGKEQREEAGKLAREASQPTATSSTMISEVQAAEIRAQVRQAINEGFAKARSKIAEVPKSGITHPSPFVIDLVTSSPSPQQVVEPGVLPASPISVANTPSLVGNGGSAPGFSRLMQNTTAASPQTMFATMQWKPKEPPCYYGRSMEDVHTWTLLVRHYLTFMGEVMPSKSRTRLPSCVILCMSGISV